MLIDRCACCAIPLGGSFDAAQCGPVIETVMRTKYTRRMISCLAVRGSSSSSHLIPCAGKRGACASGENL